MGLQVAQGLARATATTALHRIAKAMHSRVLTGHLAGPLDAKYGLVRASTPAL